MKTAQQVDQARAAVSKACSIAGLSDQQKVNLMGMSVALQWVSDAGGSTLQRLVDGEAIAPGQTAPVPDFEELPEAKEGCCGVCGLPMLPGETMFKYHGYSESCEQAKARIAATQEDKRP